MIDDHYLLLLFSTRTTAWINSPLDRWSKYSKLGKRIVTSLDTVSCSRLRWMDLVAWVQQENHHRQLNQLRNQQLWGAKPLRSQNEIGCRRSISRSTKDFGWGFGCSRSCCSSYCWDWNQYHDCIAFCS